MRVLVKAELRNTRLSCEKDTAADVGFQTDENLGHSDVPLLNFFHTIASREWSGVFTGDAPAVKVAVQRFQMIIWPIEMTLPVLG